MRRRPAATIAGAIAVGCLVLLAGTSAAASGTAAPAMQAATGWGTAIQVPGTAVLNVAGDASVTTVSCTSTGNCTAGGFYASAITGRRTPVEQAFVVDESNGTWGTAQEVPGTAALNVAGLARITSVSCTSAGNCSAGGFYASGTNAANNLPALQAFVVEESSGTWGTAQEVPGTAGLNVAGDARIVSVSCASAGNCSAGGYYASSVNPKNGIFTKQAFVVSQSSGTWGTAQEVPGTAALNAGGFAGINSVSCGSAGNCSAGGFYASSVSDGIPTEQALVVNETNGTWGMAEEVPGTAALNTGVGAYATVNSVSCASAGNCSAGGEYMNSSNAEEAFVVGESSGSWGSAQDVPGAAALNQRGLAQVTSVSCVSPGNCDAGGSYQDVSFVNQAFFVTETNGSWGTAEEVPGTATLNKGVGGAATTWVSCAASGGCGASGYYQAKGNVYRTFVASKTNGTWGTAAQIPGTLGSGAGSQTLAVSCAAPGYCGAGGYYTDTSRNIQAFVVNGTVGP